MVGLAGQGARSAEKCAGGESAPRHPLNNAKGGIKAGVAGIACYHERQLWGQALDQVAKGSLDGPLPYNAEGKLLTWGWPTAGEQQKVEERTVDDLRRSRTKRAAAFHTPVYLPMGDHFAAATRPFQVPLSGESLAVARVDHKAA